MGSVDLGVLGDTLAATLGEQVVRGEPLGPFTTYRVGGPAAVLVHVQRVAELIPVAEALRVSGAPMVVVGRGSNLLVADRGFAGLAVVLEGELEAINFTPTQVRAGGAVALPVLARCAAAEGRAGLEFYVGIPGSVGGAVRMNAGGHGHETRDVLRSATIADLATDGVARARPVADLGLGYRTSALGPTEVVVGAELAVEVDDPAACEARLTEVVRWRRRHQPGGSNAGSVFRNPPGDHAGRLVEECGCKGLRVGGAQVSTKHANFIQAERGATAADVRTLIETVRRRVAGATGVELETELHLVGFEESG
ncbi:MAG: UDP-N-acetylmuramate dehydrogenase [Actinobacteria bacterium]|nr:UDP-N-acetylmuramate dehydrogenase [Actinomycetota bacterium]